MGDNNINRLEFAVAGVLSIAIAALGVINCIAGEGIWRDEVATVGLAKMTLRDLWSILPFESFPPLFHMLLRSLFAIGIPDSALLLRIIGLSIWMMVLVTIWVRLWPNRAKPLASLALFASVPLMIRFGSSMRAYGLATLFGIALISFTWKYLHRPSWRTWFPAAVCGLLGAHCLYQFWFLIASVCLAAAVVTSIRRTWKQLAGAVAIGIPAAMTVPIYFGLMQKGAASLIIAKKSIGMVNVIDAFRWSLSVPSRLALLWWIGFFVLCLIGVMILLRRHFATRATSAHSIVSSPRDYVVFYLITGTSFSCAILFFLQLASVQIYPWHLLLWLGIIAAIADSLFTAAGPWLSGKIRLTILGLTIFGVTTNIWAGWTVINCRYTSIDFIAQMLKQQGAINDLIVVSPSHFGISFNYHYQGQTPWVTVPPLSDHRVQRNDLIMAAMQNSAVMGPIERQIQNTLRSGGVVWLIGQFEDLSYMSDRPKGLILGPYGNYWSAKVMASIQAEGASTKVVSLKLNQLVSKLENPTVMIAHKIPALR